MSKNSFASIVIILLLALTVISLIVFQSAKKFQADGVLKNKQIENLLNIDN